MPTPVETLSALHTTLVDAVKGYEEAAKLAKRDALGGLSAEIKRVHMNHAHELAGRLLEHGERPDADGSYMTLVHKLSLRARFIVTADEKSLLPALRDGEKRILERYDDTLREVEIAREAYAEADLDLLRRQRETVIENIAKLDTHAEQAA
ncbi:MAG: DUF2383 domain-containing protein [Natronohydrobacter sp.]|jgi:uncharacterized protein (TIGR02284 family)|nr:DUF2383 domain-containing protein [Natronohydrobacter sp.]